MRHHDRVIPPRIILPRLVVRERIPPPAQIGLTLEPQELHWQILGPDGRVVREADQPCHNVVLNNAKELVATLGLFEQSNWAVVGTGSTAPNASQTGLAAEIARTDQTVSDNPDTTTEVSTGIWEITRYRQLTAAQVGGQNLTEWGWSGSGTAGNNLMSRELFRDGSNNPITLTLYADQQLRLIYKIRVTVGPTTPQAASINITGIGIRSGLFCLQRRIITGSYGYNANPVEAFSIFARGSGVPKWIYGFERRTIGYGESFWSISNMREFAGAWMSYNPNSKERKMASATRGTQEINGTIYGIGCNENHLRTGPYPRMYFQFDEGQEITKNNLHELTIAGFGISWT